MAIIDVKLTLVGENPSHRTGKTVARNYEKSTTPSLTLPDAANRRRRYGR
jgi:hypothetical protein